MNAVCCEVDQDRFGFSRFFVLRALVLVFLGAVTIILFQQVDFYQTVDDKLPVNITFGGTVKSLAKGKWHLLASDNQKTTQLLYTFADSIQDRQYIRAVVTLAVNQVVPGDKQWQKVRVALLNSLDNKWLWGESPQFLWFDKPVEQQQYELTLPISQKADTVILAVQLLKASGDVVVDSVKFVGVKKDTRVAYAVKGLLLLWCVTAVWVFYPLLRTWLGCVALLCIFAFLFLLLMPIEYVQYLFNWMRLSLSYIGIDQSYLTVDNLSYAGHVVLFFMLTGVLLKIVKGSVVWLFISLLGVSIIVEVLQYFAIGRQVTVSDWLCNLTGIVAVFLIYMLYFTINQVKG